MPCVTYLSDHEKRRPVKNSKVAEALAELRTATRQDWVITEREFVKGWLRPKRTVLYALLVDVYEGIEYQVINFYRDGTDWSINHHVPAELVIAYMYGAIGQAKESSK